MKLFTKKSPAPQPVIEFLPDADEIERRPLPRLARITLYVILTMICSFLLWAALFKIDRVVVAKGRLVATQSNVVVQPLETSIIQSIDVKVGQVVKKGEKLATLDATFAEADQSQLQSHIQSLENQSKRLEAELAGTAPPAVTNEQDKDNKLENQLSLERQSNYRAQIEKMTENIAGLKAALETNRHDQTILASRVKSLQEIELMQEKLVADKFGAKISLLEARERRQEVERDLILTRNREQELHRQFAAAEADKEAFEKGWRQKMMEELLTAQHEQKEQTEQLRKAEKRHKLVVLTAPSDAVVLEIGKLSQGSIIREAETLFTLVPLGSQLETEVQIDSVDAGYVRPGAKARIKVDAFPFQQHGILDGEVKTISEDAFRRDSSGNATLTGQTPGQGTDAFYLSRINFGNSKLSKMPERSRMLPGMTLSAEIVVGRRSVLSYILWPLRKSMDESLGE